MPNCQKFCVGKTFDVYINDLTRVTSNIMSFKFWKMSKKKNNEELEEELIENQEAQEETVAESDDAVATLEANLAEAKDKHLRLFAEFENFRKRSSKEKLELRKTAAADTLLAILPVLDDFDRAKKSADSEDSEEKFSEGVVLVYDKLYKTLDGLGLEQMESTNEPFDPEIHEAITEIPAPTEELKGKVIDTIEKGYKLNDKIIRYAKVVVGK